MLPNLPGFLTTVHLRAGAPDVFDAIYPYAWFTGFLVSGALFFAITRRLRS